MAADEVMPLPRWFAGCLVAAALLVLAGGAWFYYGQRREVRDSVARNLMAIAELKEEQIAAWRRDQLTDAALLRDDPILRESTARFRAEPTAEKARELRGHFGVLAKLHDYADVLLVDAEGTRLLCLTEPGEGHVSDGAALAEALRAREPVFCDIHVEGAEGSPHVSVVAPLYADAERREVLLGALVLVSDASQFLYPLVQSWPTPSESAETLLVRRDGDDVLFLNDLRHRADAALKLRIPVTQVDVPAVMAVLGRRGLVEGKDYRGVQVVSVLLPIAESQWFMVAKQDAEEVFGEWRSRSLLILGTLAALLCGLGALGLVAWQQREKASYQALYRAEARLRAAAERHSVTLRSIGDAVIASDSQGRVELLNPVAETLTGWPEAEARGRPLEEVFHIVSEETGRVVENPVAKVLREGVVVGLANHTLLVGRDGKERPIADSGAPIRDQEGATVGVVLVFRDQTAERAAARAQRESEARYRRTLDGMLEGCQIIGFDWRYVYMNAAAEEHNRRPKEELLGKRCGDVWPGIEETEVFERIRRCLEERVPAGMENLFVFPDGRSGWFDLRIEPVPEGVFILSMDVTKRKLAEGRLRHLTDVLRAMRDVNQLIVHEDDAETLVGRACETLTETRGYRSAWIALRDAAGGLIVAAESGIGEAVAPLREAVARGDGPGCCREALAAPGVVVTHGADVNCVKCPLAGTYRDAAALACALRYGEREYGVLVVALPANVSDDPEEQSLFEELAGDIGFALHGIEMRAEQRKAEETVRAMFNGIYDGILLADLETRRFLDANPAMCRMLGRSLEEVRALSLGDIHPAESVEAVAREFDRQARGEMALATNIPVLCSDGSVFPADVSSARLEVDGRRCMLGVFRDITPRLRLESQLQQAQKMESVGRLAGGVAHDFNNLLMGIMGYAELCRGSVAADHPIREWLDEILRDAQRSANLTRQLLAFARRQTIAPKVLDINDAVAGMLKLLRRLIGEDIVLTWVPGATVWPVKVDPGQVDQLLANLCINARDAIPGAGRITIETGNATIDRDYCEVNTEARPGEYVLLAMSDDGCGMDRGTLAHIFEPFFTTKPVGQGTGLGLATVYGIVKQNDGFVNVYSEPGKGTTFRIYLPRHEGSAGAKGAAEGLLATQGGTEAVMLVEDEKSVRVTTALFLQVLGYTVLTAASPDEALRAAAEHCGTIHLLITDVVMPGMSGRELAAKLHETYPDMKCLHISGYTANVIAHRGILDEGVHFLAKPFTRDEIARKVREVLDGG
ncbi:MAG: PAS domain-containing protein [Planctomycetes bacterium]|nr:PAS domain-containing protein [Planctomycetota bacterium]